MSPLFCFTVFSLTMVKKSEVVSKTTVNPKSKTLVKNRLPKKKRAVLPARGVVYLGRLPKTFFESDIKAFFSQFGKVLRVRVSRSKKNAHSKGFGYVEFELEEIAKIAAEAANSYFIGGRAIKAEVMAREKVHPRLFKDVKKGMVDMSKARQRDNRVRYEKAAKQPNEEKRSDLADRLKELGIKYTLPTPQ